MRNTEKYAISYASSELQRVQTSFEGVESITHQDQIEQTDINNIVRDYALNGQVTVGASRAPTFGDFSEVRTYDQALTFIRDAETQFMDLPAKERAEFDNDPQKWVEHHLKQAEEAANAEKAAQEAQAQAEAEKTALENAQALLDANSNSGATG